MFDDDNICDNMYEKMSSQTDTTTCKISPMMMTMNPEYIAKEDLATAKSFVAIASAHHNDGDDVNTGVSGDSGDRRLDRAASF